MRLLLDTHAFLWWDSDPARFSPRALALCQDSANTLLLSVASVWELEIKLQLNKLKLALPLAELIETQRQSNGLEILPITLEHVLAIEKLPPIHKDPFDRLLVAQANAEDIVLISGDHILAQYPARVVW